MAATTAPSLPQPAVITDTTPLLAIPPDFNPIPQRARFFTEFDNRPAGQPVSHFCKEHKNTEWCPSQPTASRWLARRQALLEARVRPAKKKGVKRKEIDNVVSLLASRRHDRGMDKEEWEGFKEMGDCSRATLRRRMKANAVVKGKVKKMTELTQVEKEKRVEYGGKYKHETVESLWQWVHWTGEACVERAAAVDQFITLTPDTTQSLASLISRPEDREDGVLMETDTPGRPQVLWPAASVSWHHKSKLIFWNDRTHGDLLNEWQALRPRRGLEKLTEESFQAQLRQWQDKRPGLLNTPIKQQMYSQQILPQHTSYLQAQKTASSPTILAYSDNNIPTCAPAGTPLPPGTREKARLQLHHIPAQSPDMDPM